MENKIYVVTHKPFRLSHKLLEKGYETITVGDCTADNGGIRDSDGSDQISAKNKNYCELTAAYWIWKNTDAVIKGFCHYRRYFTHNTLTYNEDKIVGIEEIGHLLEGREACIILPERKYYDISAEQLYLQCGYRRDLDATREAIRQKCPQYLDTWDSMLKSNTGYLTNMMIANAALYDAYCSWLFDILQEVEAHTNLENYSVQEARVYGYLSERLLGVWVAYNRPKVVEFQCINPQTDRGMRFILYRLASRLGVYKTIKTAMWKIKNESKNR